MKKNEYSKRDYNKKIYWSGDKKDLRKSFPKWTSVLRCYFSGVSLRI